MFNVYVIFIIYLNILVINTIKSIYQFYISIYGIYFISSSLVLSFMLIVCIFCLAFALPISGMMPTCSTFSYTLITAISCHYQCYWPVSHLIITNCILNLSYLCLCQACLCTICATGACAVYQCLSQCGLVLPVSMCT